MNKHIIIKVPAAFLTSLSVDEKCKKKRSNTINVKQNKVFIISRNLILKCS